MTQCDQTELFRVNIKQDNLAAELVNNLISGQDGCVARGPAQNDSIELKMEHFKGVLIC